MSSTAQKKLLKKIRDRIVKEYKPEKIILFGSLAYGKPAAESDFDLLIIKRTTRGYFDRIREISDIFGLRNFSLDVIVRTPDELEKRLKEGSVFYEEIVTKGKVLYEKTEGSRALA